MPGQRHADPLTWWSTKLGGYLPFREGSSERVRGLWERVDGKWQGMTRVVPTRFRAYPGACRSKEVILKREDILMAFYSTLKSLSSKPSLNHEASA
jgi:hypothetical protein